MKYFYIKISICLALSYWALDSIVHYFLYKELEFEIIPHDTNELWMRIVIFILLIFFGFFADHHTYKIIKKEKEKQEVYKAMVNASQHILNNFLQSMTLIRDVADHSNDIDKKIIQLYDQTINNTANQINNLKNIQNPSKENIEERFLPK